LIFFSLDLLIFWGLNYADLGREMAQNGMI
jgi:hypothetical protein